MAKSPLLNLARQKAAAAGTRQRATRPGKPGVPTALDLKQTAQRLREDGKYEEARKVLRQAIELAPADQQPWIMLGYIDMSDGAHGAAHAHFERALELAPDDPEAHQGMATTYYLSYQNEAALRHIDRTLEKKPGHTIALVFKVQVLTRLFRMEEASALSKTLIDRETDPEKSATHWNDLGNIKRAMSELEAAEQAYRKAASLTKKDPVPLSNWLTLLHYMPDRSPADILEGCKEWARRFAPPVDIQRPVPSDLTPSRPLRIGMYSDGFRQHPVGAMTTSALEHLAKLGFELYVYTTNSQFDELTQRLMAVATRWTSIANVLEEELARRVREDGIDILMDLAGHNAGNRIRTMTLQPAPILMKWVGGLINTTGVEAIDYLLTDNVECPPGSDDFYTEKLVRLPDDYICYVPPSDAPELAPLPARKNGYITFGCFNNPAKINEVVLEKWAALMNAVPGSRLYLKGGAYGSDEMRQRIQRIMQGHGIDPQRVRLEGQSPHRAHMRAYNEVDIALDPWPYSGGLTTCEALMMGVPVVTLPGPTFAGRHSATHLVNAGLPELVVADWDQYQARVLELVGDLDSLSTIRQHLRDILLKSPVCDARRFSRNLANALRAVWQRYVDGKAPAALSFTPEGQPWFAGDDAPMVLEHPDAAREAGLGVGEFDFTFQGQIVTLDHGGALVGSEAYAGLGRQPALQTVAIDPAGQIAGVDLLRQQGVLQHYHARIALGDGQPAVLHACLDAALSGSLEPLPASRQLPFARQGATVLARLPLPTTRLDDIDGLGRIDWLALNDTHDNLKILQGAQRHLGEALIVQVAVLFAEIFQGQPDLAAITALLRPHGLRMLRVESARYRSYFPESLAMGIGRMGSQLFGADAVFVPDADRLKALDDNRKLKLAFLLHAAYGATDLAYHVLQLVDEKTADRYLAASGLLKRGAAAPAAAANDAAPTAAPAQPAAPGPRAPVIEAPELLRSRRERRRAYIGLPVYNEEKYIEQTIRSLKEQDADDVGFLVCDNASTDRTLDIIRDVAGDDARFEIFRQPENRGAFANFQFAYDNSDSEYFMWLGGHDFLSPGYVAGVMQALDADPGLSMAFGMPYGIKDEARDPALAGPVPAAVYDFKDLPPVERYVKSVAVLANCTIFHSLFRRAHLADFEMREVISGDHVLLSRLLWKGQLAYVDDVRYYRRYFAQRSGTQAERITGKKQTLSRADFVQHYLDDFAKLGKGVLNAAQGAKLKRAIKDMLAERFGA